MENSNIFRTITLSETTVFIVDNRGKTVPTEDKGIPLIATNCINNKNLYPIYERIRYISQNTYDTWFRAHPIAGDILLTLKGSQNGAVCLVPEEVGFVIAQDMVGLRANTNVINSLFLFAALRSPKVQSQIKNLDVSGVIPHLKKSDFDKLLLPYPNAYIQKEIGEFYFNLSSKIDLLNKQNQTVQELSNTFFRQWMIKEAKDEWEQKPLSVIAIFLNGLACQKFPPKNDIDKLPVLKIKDLKVGISNSSDWATIDVKPEYIIESGDVIFAWSASLMVKMWDGEKCILNQHLFKVTSSDYPKWFYYQWCKYHLANFIAIAQAHATTMGHIKRGDLDNAMCVVPTDDELKVMSEQMVPLMQKMENNSKQIKTLENMRDILLPKLMSGEVRIVT